jgi:mono/diheme cytochrome c family protein
LTRKNLLVTLLIGLLLTACGGVASASSLGDPADGKTLFHHARIGAAPGCVTCHSLEPGKVIVGPSLAGVGTRAGKRIPGKPAYDYLYECITNPNSYIVNGFSAGVMYQHFGEVLTEEQINNLVAYLLTLE